MAQEIGIKLVWEPGVGFVNPEASELQFRDYLRAKLAAKMPGRTLHVALALAHVSRLRKSNTVMLPAWALAEYGIAAKALRSGLCTLEGAGWISVERAPGRKPRITLQGKLAIGAKKKQEPQREADDGTHGNDSSNDHLAPVS